jgi:hypothetical protein
MLGLFVAHHGISAELGVPMQAVVHLVMFNSYEAMFNYQTVVKGQMNFGQWEHDEFMGDFHGFCSKACLITRG